MPDMPDHNEIRLYEGDKLVAICTDRDVEAVGWERFVKIQEMMGRSVTSHGPPATAGGLVEDDPIFHYTPIPKGGR